MERPVGTLMEQLFATNLAVVVGRAMGKVSDAQLPPSILKQVIMTYSLATGIVLDDVEEPAGGFKSFGEFFGRRLREGARAVCRERKALICPCDGRLVAKGEIDSTEAPAFAVKGSRYTLGALLGAEAVAPAFRGGGFLVIYLHPRDYHRVHAPAEAELFSVRHIPGFRYPVNSLFESRVAAIYGKNERMAFHFRLPSGREFALVMIAAFGVGNLKTRYDDLVEKRGDRVQEGKPGTPIAVLPGSEIGAFLIGSTVVMVWSRNAFVLQEDLALGPVAMGRRLGREAA